MDFLYSDWFRAFLLTLGAGLSTSLGAGLAFVLRRDQRGILALAMGFSAGVMLFVSFAEIWSEAVEQLQTAWSEQAALGVASLAFFGGMGAIALIDRLVPHDENPHEFDHAPLPQQQLPEPGKGLPAALSTSATPPAQVPVEPVYNRQTATEPTQQSDTKLYRMGLFTALAIAIHNFPEGMATFISAYSDAQLGIAIAVAIAIHNIPEGLAVALPIFYATGKKRKAFWYASLSGLAEPLGALLGFAVLRPFLTDTLFGLLYAAIAGVMVFISLDQLLPGAETYGKHHIAILGLVSGMALMALSLVALA